MLALAGGGLPLRSCNKIIDLRPGAAAQFLVVGCIYKEQVLKPSILDEYSGEEYCRRRISCCAVCLKPLEDTERWVALLCVYLLVCARRLLNALTPVRPCNTLHENTAVGW